MSNSQAVNNAHSGSAIHPLPAARSWLRTLAEATTAEWIKFWSLRSTWLGLAGGALLVVLLSVVNGTSTAINMHHAGQPADTALPVQTVVPPALLYSVFVFLAVAMLSITGEYSTGSIRSTLQAVPRRGIVLAAKGIVVAVVFLAVASATILAAAALAYPLVARDEFGGYGIWQTGHVLVTAVLGGVWVALLGLITLGLGAALRSSVGTLSTTFLLLAALPLILMMLGNDAVAQVAARTPLLAGFALLGQLGGLIGPDLAYGRGEAVAYLLAWAAAALAVGYVVLQRRDA